MSDSELLVRAEGVARQLKIAFDRSSTRVVRIGKWPDVLGNNMMVRFNAEGELASFSGKSSAIPGSILISDREGAISRAVAFCNLLELNVDAVQYQLGRDEKVARVRSAGKTVGVSLEDKPNGYRSSGGNSITISLEKENGSLEMINVRKGYTYTTPNIQVTPTAAARVAQQALLENRALLNEATLQIVENLETLANHHELMYVRANKGLGAQLALNDPPGSPMRLRYEFVVNGCYADVDAETGQLVGGGITKMGEPRRRTSSSVPWVPVAGGVTLLLGIAVGLWRLRR